MQESNSTLLEFIYFVDPRGRGQSSSNIFCAGAALQGLAL